MDILRNLKCLRTLDLSFNQITGDTLDETVFEFGGFYLHKLILNNNPLKSLPPNVITEPYIPDLRELDLSYCDLEKINRNSVDDFIELKLLNLSFNKLTMLDADIFKGLLKLEHLDLRGNQLVYFPEHIFADLRNLKTLLLSDNKIEGFHESAFYRDTSLQNLDLSNNRLTSIPYTVLYNVTKLQNLDLSQNPIKEVTISPTQSSVESLVMDKMPELTELGPYALASFPKLVSISISDNQELETIHSKFLGDHLSVLKQVRMENNKLYTLNTDALPWKQLDSLKVGGNKWMCDDYLGWMIEAASIKEDVTCSAPLMLKGHNIKTLNSEDLMKDYSLQSATAVIIFFLILPVIGVCFTFFWRRRRFCPCSSATVNSQYVTLFTRDMDEEGKHRMTIDIKVNANRLSAVSNGRADDSLPFITVKEKSIKEEIEADM